MKKTFVLILSSICLIGCSNALEINSTPISSSCSLNTSITTSNSNSTSSSSSITSSSSSIIDEKFFTATFLNYDGSTLYVDSNVKEGTIPEYKGETPSKNGTYKLKYVFDGWDIPLEPIYKNTTYTATFKEEELYYTIQDLISFDGEKPTHYGKEVFLENVGIVSVYSENTFCVTSVHDPLDTFAIEVKARENIEETYTKRDVVNVVGILDVINGRPFINDAIVSWGYDGDDYSADDAAYIGTVKMEDREYWESKITRENSGLLYYSYMTIASLPEINIGKDLSFYVTFPGEDIEVSDSNPFLIEVKIPALTSEEAEYISSWAQQFKKGDGIYINVQIYYDNQKMFLLPFDILKSNSFNIPYTHKNVHSEYAPVSSFINEEYSSNYIILPDMSNDYTYNYVTKKGSETINNSTMKYSRISFYTYQQEELMDYLISLYSSSVEFTCIGFDSNEKYWIDHPYSPNLDMHICIYQGFGKVIFEMHFLK